MAIETFVNGNPATPAPTAGTTLLASFLNALAVVKDIFSTTIDACSYNNGDLNATTINLAVAAIGAANRTLVLKRGTWTINANVDLSATNIHLVLEEGCILEQTSTNVFIFPASFKLRSTQHFIGSSLFIAFVDVDYVIPQWWGATVRGQFDCVLAIHLALAACDYVYLPRGRYLTTTAITMPGRKSIRGFDSGSMRLGSTITKPDGNYSSYFVTDSTDEDYDGISIENIYVTGGETSIWGDVENKYVVSSHYPRTHIKNVTAEPTVSTIHTGMATAGSSTTLTLAPGASAVPQFYQKMIVQLTGGTGAGQVGSITSYNSVTKQIVVETAFSTAPNSSTTYAIVKGGYLGNGVRLHDDNHNVNGGSMGCWLSTIRDCRMVGVVGLVPATHPGQGMHLALDIDANGGFIEVSNCSFLRYDVGAWVRGGENITFAHVDLEQMPGGTYEDKVHASLIVGSPNSHKIVKGFEYSGYIEVCGRAIMIQNTFGCKIHSSYINPTRGWDKLGADDGLIYLQKTALGVSIENSSIEVNFSQMSVSHSEGPVYLSSNNILFRNISSHAGVPQTGAGANGVYSSGTQPIRTNDWAIALDSENDSDSITDVVANGDAIQLEILGHDKLDGAWVWVEGIVGTVGAKCNGRLWQISVVDVDNVTLLGSEFDGAYTSDGNAWWPDAKLWTDYQEYFSGLTTNKFPVWNGTKLVDGAITQDASNVILSKGTIHRDVDNDGMVFRGGTGSDAAASLHINGGTGANFGDFKIRSNGNDIVKYDESVGTLSLLALDDLPLNAGKVVKVGGVQVLKEKQTGLGAALGAGTASGSYGATEQALLQAAYDKIRTLETITRAHGFGDT